MKARIFLGALALALVVVGCKKDEPKKQGQPGGTTTIEEIKDIALEVGGKKYGSGSEIAFGELELKEGPAEGIYEVEAALDIKAIDKSFVGNGYSLVVEKASHQDNQAVGLGSVCLNVCPPVEGPVGSVTLPVSEDDPTLSIYPPNEDEHKSDNQIVVHYAFKAEALEKAVGQTYKVKLTLSRGGKPVYTAFVSFGVKK
ncbi:MAG: hypothetical protein Q4A61_03785 [Porphyromonadaceae bacterium]|nr:hypothetical protein [Porphyromonadaceae bacterium]